MALMLTKTSQKIFKHYTVFFTEILNLPKKSATNTQSASPGYILGGI